MRERGIGRDPLNVGRVRLDDGLMREPAHDPHTVTTREAVQGVGVAMHDDAAAPGGAASHEELQIRRHRGARLRLDDADRKCIRKAEREQREREHSSTHDKTFQLWAHPPTDGATMTKASAEPAPRNFTDGLISHAGAVTYRARCEG